MGKKVLKYKTVYDAGSIACMYACACVMVFVAACHQLQWLSHLCLPCNMLLQRGIVREGHLECVGLAIWKRGRSREEEGREGDEQDSVLMLD